MLGVPTLLAFGPAPRRAFDEKPLRVLKKERPECVLLGDSMLETRIDQETMSRVSGRKCLVLAKPGSSSATWYLMLKNLIAVQSTPPQTVIVFYRNRQLTLPAHRAEGDYRKSMEPFMSASEPVLESLINQGKVVADPLERAVQAVYPTERRREQAQEKVQAWALDLVASSREYEVIHNDAKKLFSPKNLRGGTAVDEQKEGGLGSLDPDDHIFAEKVEASFLPRMLEIAREKKIQLLFFEVKRRPNPDGSPGEESATGDEYDAALHAYLEKAGARYFDETRETDITLDFYGSGDHVATAMMPRYTELFWQKIGKLVNPPTDR